MFGGLGVWGGGGLSFPHDHPDFPGGDHHRLPLLLVDQELIVGLAHLRATPDKPTKSRLPPTWQLTRTKKK